MGINNRKQRRQKKQNKLKKKKCLKKKRTINHKTSNRKRWEMIQNPFTDLNNESRKKIIQNIAENNEEIYYKSLAKVNDILHCYDPIALLSILAFYDLNVGVSDAGIQTKDNDLKIYQSHVELCQGLALKIKPENLKNQPFASNIVQELRDALSNLMYTQNLRDITQNIENKSDEQKAILLLQQWIRRHTKIVRNWGYFSQVISFSQEIYNYFDKNLENKYGFSTSNIIELFRLLVKEIDTANTNRNISILKLYELKDKKELVFKYHELIGESAEKADIFIKNIKINSLPIKSLFAILLSHYDLMLPENYKFSPKYLSKKIGMDESIVKKILDEFSFTWGELESNDTEHLYLNNPIWLRPIIKLEEYKYFCALPQVFFSFIIPSVERFIEGIDKTILSKRRSDYLETKIVEIINRRFPESNTIAGLKWKFNNIEYETDLITFIDSHAIIVEAKSGKITNPALRGAPDRIKKHIEKILIAPNIQSKRLKKKLNELINSSSEDDELQDQIPVKLNTIHKIIRISVSLEDFSSIQSNIGKLRETGWLPDKFEPCPTMSVSDFETLFDFLEHPVQIIHYLERRQELEKSLGYIGDEIDLMGLYIETLFNFNNLDLNIDLVITGMSSPLDKYYTSKDIGIDIPKPKPNISPLFTGIINQLEKRQTQRWTEIGVILHRFSPDDQKKLTRMVKKLDNNVRKNWMKEDHKNIIVYVPNKTSSFSICYVIYNNNTAYRRYEFIQNAANHGLIPEHIKQCLVIAKNIDDDYHHYHFIGLME